MAIQTQLPPPPVRDTTLSVSEQRYLAMIQFLLPRIDVDTTAAPVTIALPSPGQFGNTGQTNQNQERIYVKTSADVNAVTITGAISGTVTLSTQWATARFKSNGNDWVKS